jgi:hypothetical protein
VAVLVWFLTLAGSAGADTMPSVTFKCTPAPADCTGWYQSDVTIDWTVLPSNSAVTGCEDKTFTADTPGTTEFCRADDGSGAMTIEVPIKVDKTPPVVTGGRPSRAADFNGWYNQPVAVEFDGSDLTSGIASCTATTYGGPDSGAASLDGTCVDRAGNVSAPFGYGLRYDQTDPEVTSATPERPPNGDGWFNRAVRFEVAGRDPASGIAACAPVTYSGPDDAAASIVGSCRDHAGNEASRAFALKFDATAPVATGGRAAREPDAGGWYNRPVAVSFSGSDQLSGVNACTSVTYAGPDSATTSVPGTCTDRAGNESASVPFPLRYDATKPVVTGGRPGRPANADGWYRQAIQVAFDGSDQTAGIDACSTASYAGPDSAAASVSGTCIDRAGNVSSPFGYGLKYDATPPAVTSHRPARPPDAGEWYSSAVAFSFQGDDATSGIAGCPPVTYAGPDSRAVSVTGECRDRAGNVADRTFGPYRYDGTAPEMVGAVPDRPPNEAGWYRQPVSVAFDGRDATAGIASCMERTYAGPDSGAASVGGTCRDAAGNVSAALAFALKYDATAPAVTGGAPGRPPDAGGWYNHAVSVAFGGTDPTSGIEACTTASYGGPDTATASVSGSCGDRAGNFSGPRSVTLKYDETGPEVTGVQAERAPDHDGWFVDPVRFDVTGTDATSGIDQCPPVTYSGPDGAGAFVTARCHDRAGNASGRGFPLNYDATAPAVTGLVAEAGDGSVSLNWLTSPDTTSVEVVRTPGLRSEPASVVFRGPGAGFVDRQVVNGTQYAYEVRVRDAAGHSGARTVTCSPVAPPAAPATASTTSAVPSAPAAPAPPSVAARDSSGIAPAPGSVLVAGSRPLLEWPAVRRARYYNVQLFRDGRKVLSAWPEQPRLRLKLRWTYRGERQRLRPGRYRWMVWPGYGPRPKADYGKRIVRSTFEIR